jgi:hypothetical protein
MGTQTIYWAAFNQEPTPDLELKSLVRHIATTQNTHLGENHVACPAIRSKHSNTFYSTFPYDLEVMFKDKLITNKPEVIEQRTGLYENSYAFNWHYNRIFFSPIPQMMETSPAFLHQTSYSQYGHAPSGGFDIGKWFRPSAPAFQLWSGVNEFKALKGEAHLYFNFPSKDKIEFKEFTMTNTLYEISMHSVTHKQYLPKQNLNSLYRRFTEGGFKKKIMAEIEANLL